MTSGVGGSAAERELTGLLSRVQHIQPISKDEHQSRVDQAVRLMHQLKIDAALLPAGSSLYYFTGLRWSQSERLTAALLTASGSIHYICPTFEVRTLAHAAVLSGAIHGWEEHENPYLLVARVAMATTPRARVIALDETAPFFLAQGLRTVLPSVEWIDAVDITRECRMHKSAAGPVWFTEPAHSCDAPFGVTDLR